MTAQSAIKRLFFGVEVQAPWPAKLPLGRHLHENQRHLTLAFLGNIPYAPLQELLSHLPQLHLTVGLTGYFDTCLMLPLRHPNVIAWRAHWYEADNALVHFQKEFSHWLTVQGYKLDQREWLPHATLARRPFDPHAWKKTFEPLPFYTKAIHLYESTGQLNYVPLWSYPLQEPFEEIEHTADMAFIIRGQTLSELYHNAFTALAFKQPALLTFFEAQTHLSSLDDVIIALNAIVGRADSVIGCPLKAISFHGEIAHLDDTTLQWEMIVDV